MFNVLSVPSFRWLWTGQLLSQFGNAVFLVMGLWEIQLKSPFLLSIAGLAMMLPQLLAAVGGIAVDRFDARKLMLWTDLLRGVGVLLGLLLLWSTPEWKPWIIIGLLAINALGNALFGPAEMVVLPSLVPDTDLSSANGLYSLTYQLSSAIGSGIGGAAIATVGVSLVFGFDLGSFWISALAIMLMIRITTRTSAPSGAAPAEVPTTRVGFRQGWQAISGLRWFVALLPAILLANFTFAGAFVLLPYWMHHHLGATVAWYGITDGAWAMGTVVGSLTAGLLGRYALNRTVGIMGLVQAVLMGVFALAHLPLISAGALLLAGVANGGVNALMFTLLQRVIPAEIRGRAFGLLMTVLMAASPLAALLSGLSLHVVPIVWWYAASAISGGALGGALWWLAPTTTAESTPRSLDA